MNFLKNAKAFLKMLTPLSIFLFFVISLKSQTSPIPTLVKDIKLGGESSLPMGFTQYLNKVYFTAEGDFNGVYTGTDRRIFSMANGNSSPEVLPFNIGNGLLQRFSRQKTHLMQGSLFLFVRRNDTIHELWKTNGTTEVLVDTIANFNRTQAYNVVTGSVYFDKLYFTRSYRFNSKTQIELYRHSGIKGGNQFIATTYSTEDLPSTSSFTSASEEVKNYFPTPDVTYTDVIFDSIGLTPLRGLRRSIRAHDNTNGTFKDIYTIAWRGNYTESNNRLTGYKVIGAINSSLLFTSRESATFENPSDTIFSLDRNGVKNIIQLNVGSPIKVINLGNRIIYLDAYFRIWETDGTTGGTRILVSNRGIISDIYFVNGQVYFLTEGNLPNLNIISRIWSVDGVEIGTYENLLSDRDKLVVFRDNKNLFLLPQISQSDTVKRIIYQIGDVQNPFKKIGIASKCKQDFDNLSQPIDSICPCLIINNSSAQFTVFDSTLLFTASSQANGEEVWKMNINEVNNILNPCATDTINPVFQACPSNINLSTAGTNSVANWTMPTATDNCGIPSVSVNFPSGTTFPLGTTKVIYTATDAKNNSSTCSFNITVNTINPCINTDVTSPRFTNCPASIYLTTTGTTATATWQPITATDDCTPNPIISGTYASGTAFPLGSTAVDYRATDAKGLSTLCTFYVNVFENTTCTVDSIKPYFSYCPPSQTVITTGTTATATWALPTATDNCVKPIISSGAVSGQTFQLGSTPIGYTAIDYFKNQSSCIFFINVVKETVSSDICVNIDANIVGASNSVTVSGITTSSAIVQVFSSNWALLATQIATTSSLTIPNLAAGNYIVKVTVLGAGGKWPAVCTVQKANVVVSTSTNPCDTDTTPPVIDNVPLDITVPCFDAVPLPVTITATDNCAGNVTIYFEEIRGVDITRIWTVTDTKGNTTKATQKIIINDTQAPVLNNCPININLNTNTTTAIATWVTPTATDNCNATPSVSSNYSSGFAFPVGTTNVVYTAKDAKNNTSTCSFNVNVTLLQNNSCRYNDSLTLVDFYNKTNGSNWTNKWDLNKPIDTWWGVYLNANGCVISLGIRNDNNLIGSIPSSLENLTNLESLALNGNQLTGSIPSSLGNLSNLNFLDLGINQLTGTIPTSLGNLAKLEILILQKNQLTGLIPSNFNNLTNLLLVDLNNNQLSGSISSNFSNLNKLRKLYLFNNQLTDSIPSSLGGLANLEELLLNSNKFTGQIPSSLGSLNALTFLKLENNLLSGCLPSELKRLCGKFITIGNNPNLPNNGNWEAFCSNGAGTCTIAQCDSDSIKPVISNCPANINLTTTGTTAIANWTTPTATDNCTATPSVSSNYNSGFAFPVGTTNVTYTAKDAKNNTSTCSFNVAITQQITSQDVCTNPSANVKGGASSIIVSGITTSSAIIQIFNASWSSVYNQQVSSSSVTIPNLTAGSYQVKVTVLGAGGRWPSVCSVLVNNVAVTAGNPCDNDVIAPTFSNCPSNINLITTGTTAAATWITPTAADNCTTTPSVSSNYNSGFTFPIGTTNVIYTAKDAKNNAATCNFNVTVTKKLDGIIIKYTSHTAKINDKVCVSVSADSFFNIISAQWTNTFNPAVLRFDSVINFTALGSRITDFGVSARSAGFVDFIFVGADKSVPNGTKLYDLCFTAIGQAGTSTLVKQEDVTRFRSEIYKTPNILAALKTTSGTVRMEGTAANTPDIALNIASNPTTYRQWTTNTFRITAKNNATQAMNSVKIQFQYPDKTVKGGEAVPSIGTWNEYCSGGILCYEWTIPILAANATATLDVPLFILGATAPIIATTKLLTSTPTDGNAVNNTATLSVSPISAASQMLQAVNRPKPSQLIPVVIQAIAPNPTEGDVMIEIESIIEKEVRFDFYNTLGKIVKSEIREVKKGENRLQFDFWNETNGIYFIQTNIGQGRSVPLKFVKM